MKIFLFFGLLYGHVGDSQHVPAPKRHTWSEDYIASVPAHPLCQGPEGRAFREDEVLQAVQKVPWRSMYQGFRPRALYPGAPVFPTSAGQRERQGVDSEPTVTAVFDKTGASGRAVLGASVTCEQCYQSGLPGLVQALLPASLLKGRSYLEVASLDGPRCFWAEESGATDVVCTDYHGWGGVEDANTHGIKWREAANMSRAELRARGRGYGTHSLEAFKLTKCLTGSRAKGLRINVYDLGADFLQEAVGRPSFDVVYAGGLIYHLKHPVLGFESLAEVTKGVLIFETEVLKPPPGVPQSWHQDGVTVPRPADAVPLHERAREGYREGLFEEAALCRWFREAELLGDATNFWSCTAEAYASMLRAAGFPYVHLLGLEIWPGLRAHPWRDRRVLAAAKTRQGDLRIVRSYPERLRL